MCEMNWSFLALAIHLPKDFVVLLLEIALGGACDIMVIVAGNGYGYSSSNLERGYLYFTYR